MKRKGEKKSFLSKRKTYFLFLDFFRQKGETPGLCFSSFNVQKYPDSFRSTDTDTLTRYTTISLFLMSSVACTERKAVQSAPTKKVLAFRRHRHIGSSIKDNGE